MSYILSIVYTACFIFVLFHITKFEFKFRLKYKWYFGLFNSLCLSVAELILLVYFFEKWAFKDPKIYLYFVALYDHCFAYVFTGFNDALVGFQTSLMPFTPVKFAKIQSQKVLFSLMMLAAFISLRHIVFATCNYQKSYETFKKICRTVENSHSEPMEQRIAYLILFLSVAISVLWLGSFSEFCSTTSPGCTTFAYAPSKIYVLFPYLQYLYITYLALYLFLICKLKSLDDKENA